MARASVAVVPFGARASDPRAGAWGRQIARRLVDGFAGDPALELKPVFLVALPEAPSEAGYLVFGSTPDPALAAQYARSLGATHALTGLLRADGERRLEATLVEVRSTRGVATFEWPFAEGTLQEAEPALAAWLRGALGAAPATAAPAADNEPAYRALLEGLDEEVNATLLRVGDPEGARAATARAAERFVAALRADPGCAAAEERLLVLAAESVERGEEATLLRSLEELTALLPRSWRAQYLLGELRRITGDTSGAIVAFEHADALHPLGDRDAVRLAELYVQAGAPAAAASRLRRIGPASDAYAEAQDLAGILAAQRGDLSGAIAAFERALTADPTSGATLARLAQCRLATSDVAGAIDGYRAALARGAPDATRLELARALAAGGQVEPAIFELDRLLSAERPGEVAAQARRLRLGLAHRDLEERLERAGRAAVEGDDATLDGALADLDLVLAAEPDLWEAHFGRGLVARRRKDALPAERAFRRALELWPDQPEALHELGVALLSAERTGEALALLDDAARLRPQDAGYLADAGFAHLRSGDLAAARERLAHATALDATDPLTRSYLEALARAEAAAGRTN